jgi:CRISPR-associated endonuclease/helicase Cas3
LKSLTQKDDEAAYCNPGYETQENLLCSHDLNELINFSKLTKRVDAQPRIQRKLLLNSQERLSDLEHYSIQQLLTEYKNQGATHLQGYLSGYWWMTALPQFFNSFREGSQQHSIYLMPELEDETCSYVEKVYEKGKILMPPPQTLYIIHKKTLSKQQQSRLWLQRDYLKLLKEIAIFKGMDIRYAALLYGELTLPTYGKDAISIEFTYNEQLGLTKY